MVGRSRPKAGRGYVGAIPEAVYGVVLKAWASPFSVQSNYAREAAIEVALAASMGWITNIAPDGLSFTRQWHTTPEGLVSVQIAKELTQ